MTQRIDRTVPYALVAVFTIVVQGLSLMEFLPVPAALLIGASWAAAIGFVAYRVSRRPALGYWVEQSLLGLGCTAMALFAFGGAVGLLTWRTALDSSSITGETMVTMFLPSIPIAIAANVPTELIIIPVLLILTWRPGARRILVVAAAGCYFVLRIWSYLVFVPDRLDFAAAERSTTPLTAAERTEFAEALHVNDPRWILNLVIFLCLLLAAFAPAAGSRREGRVAGPAPVAKGPSSRR